MNKLRIADFSNPYSPSNRHLITNLALTLPRTNTNTSRNRSLTSSPRHLAPSPRPLPASPRPQATSPRPFQIPVQIAHLPCIEELRKVNKLKLGKEKMNKIIDSLAIDGASKTAYDMRLKTDNPYLQFERNPLSDLTHPNKTPTSPLGRDQDKPKKNLLEAIAGLKGRKFFKDLKEKAPKHSSNANQIQGKILRKKHSLEKDEKQIIQKEKEPDTLDVSALIGGIVKSPFEELDEIVNMKDEHYFMKKRNREPFNLFELKFNPDSPMFKSGREQLEAVSFSFDSMSTNAPSNLNETMLRALSTYSRISSLRSNSKSIPEEFKINEQNFRMMDFEKIGLEDMLQIANGQLRASVLLKFINDDLQVNKRRVEEEDDHEKELQNNKNDLVILKPHQHNKELNYAINNFEQTELLYLQRDHITPAEARQKDLSSHYLQQMRTTLTKQLKCLNMIIDDQHIHAGFTRDKDAILTGQLEGDVDLNQRTQGIERKIRMSKVAKNQTEKIKIKHVIETCKERKALETAIKAKSKGKVKNNSTSVPKSKSRPKSNPKNK